MVFHCENSVGRYRLQARDRKPLAVLVYHGLEADVRRDGLRAAIALPLKDA